MGSVLSIIVGGLAQDDVGALVERLAIVSINTLFVSEIVSIDLLFANRTEQAALPDVGL